MQHISRFHIATHGSAFDVFHSGPLPANPVLRVFASFPRTNPMATIELISS
jgi:hypothetical protein